MIWPSIGTNQFISLKNSLSKNPKVRFLTKILIFDEIFDFRPTLVQFIFDQKFDFWSKVRFFYETLDFSPKLRFLTKASIFDQNFNFSPKARFLAIIRVFDQNFDFSPKISIFDEIFNFLPNFLTTITCRNRSYGWRTAKPAFRTRIFSTSPKYATWWDTRCLLSWCGDFISFGFIHRT